MDFVSSILYSVKGVKIGLNIKHINKDDERRIRIMFVAK